MAKSHNSRMSSVNTRTSQIPAFGQLTMAAMILIGATLFTGCSSLPLSSNGRVSSSAQNPVASGGQPQYLVDMQMPYGGSKKYKGNIGPGATVQSAIEASGATKKFRKMDVAVMRKIDGAFQPLKMTSSYNAGRKTISSETDYALQHGDRVVVTPTAENQVLKMLGTLTAGN